MTALPHDIRLDDGRALKVWASGRPGEFTILWHGGSPQTGRLLQPLADFAASKGVRILSYARPSYGGSTTLADRDVATAADDVRQLADAVGLGRFAVMGHSGGGPHALACAALLPDRVTAAATFASIAPFEADIDWFGGMAGDGSSLRAAAQGRPARVQYEQTAEFDPASFTARDYSALREDWAAMGTDAGAASEWGGDGLVADDLACVRPWGFDITDIRSPVLVAQGGDDRVIPASHGRWLAERIEDAELWFRPREGHISILGTVGLAIEWLRGVEA